MREINENESKSKFASMQNENNANMNGKVQKSRKRKRAIKPVRQVKKMRLEKEVRKRNFFWNCRKVYCNYDYSLCLQKFEVQNRTISSFEVFVFLPFLHCLHARKVHLLKVFFLFTAFSRWTGDIQESIYTGEVEIFLLS